MERRKWKYGGGNDTEVGAADELGQRCNGDGKEVAVEGWPPGEASCELLEAPYLGEPEALLV